jgi:Ca2+-binding EF-hand superfamily protein
MRIDKQKSALPVQRISKQPQATRPAQPAPTTSSPRKKNAEHKLSEPEAIFPARINFRFDGLENYLIWPPEAIKRAFNRMRSLKKPDNKINRMEWFDVFNDYETPIAGSFLQLPMAEFERFDSDGSHMVSSNSVFMTMVMVSPKMPKEEQAKMMFMCYDYDNSGSLAKDEVTKLTNEGMHTLVTLGIVSEKPDQSKLNRFVNSMMTNLGESEEEGTTITEEAYIEAYSKAQVPAIYRITMCVSHILPY